MGARSKSATVIRRFHRWIDEHVSQPSDHTNGIPACPFAKGAWTYGTALVHMSNTLSLVDFIKSTEPTDGLSHVVFVPIEHISLDEFQLWIGEQNQHTFGWWTMGYHPESKDNAPVWDAYDEDDHVLVLVQNLDELVAASGQLAAKGYYKNSEPWQIEDIVNRQEAFNDWLKIEARLSEESKEIQ